MASIGVPSTIPFPRNNIGRRIAEWSAGVVEALRASVRISPQRHEAGRRYHHPRREDYLADAAMAREMLRL
jgi:hypothetical protein